RGGALCLAAAPGAEEPPPHWRRCEWESLSSTATSRPEADRLRGAGPGRAEFGAGILPRGVGTAARGPARPCLQHRRPPLPENDGSQVEAAVGVVNMDARVRAQRCPRRGEVFLRQ